LAYQGFLFPSLHSHSTLLSYRILLPGP
jgi:hypothetical protein